MVRITPIYGRHGGPAIWKGSNPTPILRRRIPWFILTTFFHGMILLSVRSPQDLGFMGQLPNGFFEISYKFGVEKPASLLGSVLRLLDPLETPDLLIARMDLQSSLHDSLQSTKIICIHQVDVSWKACNYLACWLITGWWQLKYVFIFIPKIGEMIQFDEHIF